MLKLDHDGVAVVMAVKVNKLPGVEDTSEPL